MRRSLFIFIVAIVGTGILVSLGKWQMDRLAWKQDILAKIDARIQDPEIPLPLTFDAINDKYQSVVFDGRLRGDFIRVLASLKINHDRPVADQQSYRTCVGRRPDDHG